MYQQQHVGHGAVGGHVAVAGHGPAAGAAGLTGIPLAYQQQKVNYSYPTPHQNPQQPFVPPAGIDQPTAALFAKASTAFRSVDKDRNGHLDSGEFKKAMKTLSYFLPKAAPAAAPAGHAPAAPAAAAAGKKDKKDKKGKKDKKDKGNKQAAKEEKKKAKGAWDQLFRVIDKDGGGTLDEREFAEYYVWSQKQGFGSAPAGGAAHGAVGGGAGTPGKYNWVQVPGNLAKISACGAHVWGVNAAEDIWKFDGHGWTQVPGKAAHISVGGDGTTVAVNSAGEVYHWSGSAWNQLPGSLTVVSVATANCIWGINAEGKIWFWNGQAWNQIDGSASHISVGNDGCVWCTNPAGEIYRRAGPTGQWERIVGTLAVVSCFDVNSVVGVNAAGEIWAWTGSGWVQGPGAAKYITMSAAGHAAVWCTTATGDIYRHQ